MTWSQSPLCGNDASNSCDGVLKLDFAWAMVCQNTGTVPERLFRRQNIRDSAKSWCPVGQIGPQKQKGTVGTGAVNKNIDLEGESASADAKKAGSASEDTRLIHKPPSLAGKLACCHWMSDRSQLVMLWTDDLRSESKRSSAECETDGEQGRMRRTFEGWMMTWVESVHHESQADNWQSFWQLYTVSQKNCAKLFL